VIETEAIRYKWASEVGTYPDYEKLIPTEAQTEARFDTRELMRAGMAVASLGVAKDATIRLYIEESRVRLSSSDGAGEATIEAQTQGEAKTALSARYLTQVLKALGGMAELKVNGTKDPILFTVDGYRLVVMPMFVQWGDEAEMPTEPVAEAEAPTEAETPTEPVAEAEAPTEDKPRRSRKREPVAVEA
jgi:DNA polymerase-3 subunit beta